MASNNPMKTYWVENYQEKLIFFDIIMGTSEIFKN